MARMTITITVEEEGNADDLLARVATLARQPNSVDSASHAVSSTVSVADVVDTVPVDIVADEPVTDLKAAKRKVRAKKADFAELAKETDPTVFEAEAIVEETVPFVQDTIGDPVSSEDVVEEVIQEAIEAGIIPEDFDAEEKQPVATDAELGQLLSQVNAKLRDRDRILTLIRDFTGGKTGYSQVPADRRVEFVKVLKELK